MKFPGWFTGQNKHADPIVRSFEDLTEEELSAHKGIPWYDDFELTDAIRPSWDIVIKPVEGFKYHSTFNQYVQRDVPVITASVTRKKLWDLFLELTEPFGDMVDVDIDHASDVRDCRLWNQYTAEDVEKITLPGLLGEYQDFLLNDGDTKITIADQDTESSIQLDDHKFLILTGADYQARFRKILREWDICEPREMRFIDKAEHIHLQRENQVELQKLILETGADFDDDDNVDDYFMS